MEKIKNENVVKLDKLLLVRSFRKTDKTEPETRDDGHLMRVMIEK